MLESGKYKIKQDAFKALKHLNGQVGTVPNDPTLGKSGQTVMLSLPSGAVFIRPDQVEKVG